MKRPAHLLLVLFLCLSSFASFAQQPLRQKLAAYLQAQHEVNQFAGTVLITRRDTVLLHQAYGLADYEWQVPNTLDTKYALASITKHVTAIAILQLVERGQLRLTDKLSQFVPGFAHGDAITVHMLLTHTAGLALDFEELYLEHAAVSTDSALAFMRRQPARFAPGTGLAYSNVGYFLLGRIIEKASGLSYPDYLQKHIFDVAGMTDTGLNSNTALVPRLARIYYREGAAFVKNPSINWELNRGHDGLYATAADLAKLDRALRGTALLSAATKALMNTQHNKRFPGPGFLDHYGYGIFVDPYYNHGHHLLTHSGGYFGARTTFDRYPKDQLFVTVLSNNEAESHWIGYGLAGILFGKPVELPYRHRAVPIDTAGLAKYAGEYGKVRILYAKGTLHLDNLATPLAPESARKFFQADTPDRTFEFLTDRKGAVHAVELTKGGVKETVPKTTRARPAKPARR